MKEFTVHFYEVLSVTAKVDAESEEEAIQKVKADKQHDSDSEPSGQPSYGYEIIAS